MTRTIGNTVVIEPEKEQICEFCGQEKETRPYGSGHKEICFECMMETRESWKEASRIFNDVLDGKTSIMERRRHGPAGPP